jgi:hypothetical protein
LIFDWRLKEQADGVCRKSKIANQKCFFYIAPVDPAAPAREE